MKMASFYKERQFGGEHPDFYEAAAAVAKKEKIRSYADIGCSNGYGIDIVQDAIGAESCFGIDIVRPKKRVNRKKFRFMIKDLNRQATGLRNIDLVTCFEVLEHIDDTQHMIKEIHSMLRKDGLLILSTPNLAWWVNRKLLLFGFQPSNTEVDRYHTMYGKPGIMKDNIGAGHIHVFTDRALSEFLRANGFDIIKKIRKPSNYGGLMKIVSILDRLISIIPGCSRHYIYVCRKI